MNATRLVRVARWTRCRRCYARMVKGELKAWLADDTLWPDLPGIPGGWCCERCVRATGARVKVVSAA